MSEQATLAGGCFWCTEAVYQMVPGVLSITPGYTGGTTANPTYRQVCNEDTGHAEAIQITFDPTVATYRQLLEVFFRTHNPTTLNKQGADEGTQYRSAIFYHNQEQKEIAKQVIKEVEESGQWEDPVVTELTAYSQFYPAEEYHHNYYRRNPEQPYCQLVIKPKLVKVEESKSNG